MRPSHACSSRPDSVGIDPLLFCLRKQLAALVSDPAISVTVSHRKMADVTFVYYTDQSPHTASVSVTVGHCSRTDATFSNPRRASHCRTLLVVSVTVGHCTMSDATFDNPCS